MRIFDMIYVRFTEKKTYRATDGPADDWLGDTRQHSKNSKFLFRFHEVAVLNNVHKFSVRRAEISLTDFFLFPSFHRITSTDYHCHNKKFRSIFISKHLTLKLQNNKRTQPLETIPVERAYRLYIFRLVGTMSWLPFVVP